MANLRHIIKRDGLYGELNNDSHFEADRLCRNGISSHQTYLVRDGKLLDAAVDIVNKAGGGDTLLRELSWPVPLFDSLWIQFSGEKVRDGDLGVYVKRESGPGASHDVSWVACELDRHLERAWIHAFGFYQVDSFGKIDMDSLRAEALSEKTESNAITMTACVALAASLMHGKCKNGGIRFCPEIKASRKMTPISAPASVWREIVIRDSVDQYSGKAFRGDDKDDKQKVRYHIVRAYVRGRGTSKERLVLSYGRGDKRLGEVVKELTLVA